MVFSFIRWECHVSLRAGKYSCLQRITWINSKTHYSPGVISPRDRCVVSDNDGYLHLKQSPDQHFDPVRLSSSGICFGNRNNVFSLGCSFLIEDRTQSVRSIRLPEVTLQPKASECPAFTWLNRVDFTAIGTDMATPDAGGLVQELNGDRLATQRAATAFAFCRMRDTCLRARHVFDQSISG